MKTITILFIAAFFASYLNSQAQDSKQEQKAPPPSSVIVINQGTPGSQTEEPDSAITAPALVPSEAHKIRRAREQQEVNTENLIMKSLEKQRLLDEQKRIDSLLQTTTPPSKQTYPQKKGKRHTAYT